MRVNVIAATTAMQVDQRYNALAVVMPVTTAEDGQGGNPPQGGNPAPGMNPGMNPAAAAVVNPAQGNQHGQAGVGLLFAGNCTINGNIYINHWVVVFFIMPSQTRSAYYCCIFLVSFLGATLCIVEHSNSWKKNDSIRFTPTIRFFDSIRQFDKTDACIV